MDKKKVWVIESPDGPSGTSGRGTPSAPRRKMGRTSTITGATPNEPKAREHKPSVIALAYALGPLGIIATRRGRQSRLWRGLGIGSTLGAALVVSAWKLLLGRADPSATAILGWAGAACIATLVAVTVWARAVYLAARGAGSITYRLPGWARSPATVGTLGLLIPGLGLLLIGHLRRAAFALWLVGPLALSGALLWRSASIWAWNRTLAPAGITGAKLEIALLIAFAIALVGGLVWLVLAMEGARLATYRVRTRRRRSDIYAAALLAAMLLFIATFDPTDVARALDHEAVNLRDEGFRIIPLYFAAGAVRLDPSRPLYVMHTIDLHEQRGDSAEANRLRRELEERWRPYEHMRRADDVMHHDAGLPRSGDALEPDSAPPPGHGLAD